MENECEALPGVAYPGARDNRSTLNTKTGYDDDDDDGVQCIGPVKHSHTTYHANCLKVSMVIFVDCQYISFTSQMPALKPN